MDHVQYLIEEVSLRCVNHPDQHKDPNLKWETLTLKRGAYVEWLIKQPTLKRQRSLMLNTITPASVAALWNTQTPCLIAFDMPYTSIINDVRTLINSSNLANCSQEERTLILNQACNMVSKAIIYVQGENKFYQALRKDGRLVLLPIVNSEHGFGFKGLKIPTEIKRTHTRDGTPVMKVKWGTFFDYFCARHHRYDFVDWSPEALDPRYDASKLGNCFNAFSGFMRDANYFKDKWNKADELTQEKVQILREWLRNGICGGQVPFKKSSEKYFEVTESYLIYLEKLIKNMICHPWNRSGVFVVLHGDQGTGKGWLINSLAERIYGPNSPLFQTITNPEHMFGHFSHEGEGTCLMMFMDETEINKKEHINNLKNAVTEKTRNSNCKNKAQMKIQAWWQGFLATNSPTPVLIQGNERRIFVLCTRLLVGEGQKKVFPSWVGQMEKEMDVFDAWLGYVCSSYPEVTEKWHAQSERPQTYTYHNLKIRSFSPISSWWLTCLQRASHSQEPRADDSDRTYYAAHQVNPVWKNTRTPTTTWNDQVNKKWLFETYVKDCRGLVNMRSFAKGTQEDPLIKFMQEITPMIWGTKINLTRLPETNNLLQIPTLMQCIINFCKYHFISDPSMLNISAYPVALTSRVDPIQEATVDPNNPRDVWIKMRDVLTRFSRHVVQDSQEVLTESTSSANSDFASDVLVEDITDQINIEEEEEEEVIRPLKRLRKEKDPDSEEENDSFIDDSEAVDEETIEALDKLHQIHDEMGCNVEEGEEAIEEPFNPDEYFSNTVETEKYRNGEELGVDPNNPFVFE